MSEVIVITSGKGGVGKTTTTANVGTGLAKEGKKVVLIDTDIGLRNLDVVMGLENRIVYNLVDVVEGTCRLKQALIKDKRYDGLYLLPAAQTRNKMAVSPEQAKALVEELEKEFDYVLIDCPPSLSLVTINALVAADAVIVPLQCEYLALEGITDLIGNINQIKRRFNPRLELQGVVLTMYDGRNNLTQMVEEDVRSFFGNKVYQTVIPRNVRVSEAPSHGKPVLLYDFKCSGSQAYISLAGEVLKREKELIAC